MTLTETFSCETLIQVVYGMNPLEDKASVLANQKDLQVLSTKFRNDLFWISERKVKRHVLFVSRWGIKHKKSISKVTSYLDLPGVFVFSLNKKMHFRKHNSHGSMLSPWPCRCHILVSWPPQGDTDMFDRLRQENITARSSLFVIVDENLHIFGEFAWTIWGLLFGSQAPLRYQKNTTELHPHIHMTCADSLVVTYSRIFHLDPWKTRKPS